MISVVLASLSNTRHMRFPHRVWTTDAYADALASYITGTLHLTSFKIALVVVVASAPEPVCVVVVISPESLVRVVTGSSGTYPYGNIALAIVAVPLQ